MRRQGWRAGVIGVIVLGVVGSARAEAAGWADRLFNERGHDFGTVPRGVKVRHTFTLANRLAEPVTIVDVRASCGCTTGRALTPVVPPGQTGAIEAEMDTRNFVGRKETVLYVALVTASGRQGEVRLGVGSTIMSDLVLNPGAIDFGLVARGQTPSQVLTIDRVGAPGWRVERMASACRAIDATLVETNRANASVSYRLTVSLKSDAPAGLVRDEIRLLTNDREAASVPIPIAAMIRGDLSASPATLALGHVNSSGSAQGRFLVRASRPFTILGVEGTGDGFTIAVDDATAKPVHVVTLTYKPEEGTARGDLKRTFRVRTNLADESPLELHTTLFVDP